MAETKSTENAKQGSEDTAGGADAGVAQRRCRMQSVYPCTVMCYLFPFAAVALIAFLLGRLLTSF